jgi:hypothetical protein
MIREFTKDAYLAGIGSKKTFQDGFADAMEVLCNSCRVRSSSSFTYSGISRGEVIPRILYSCQDQDEGVP